MVFINMLTLTHLARRSYDHVITPVCTRHNITRMELDVLLFLANNPGRDTAAELISLRGLTKSHVSAAVAGLAMRGLLARSHRDGNRKTVHLTLLPAAAPIIADGQAAQQQLAKALIAGFSDEELTVLNGAAERIIENMRAVLD